MCQRLECGPHASARHKIFSPPRFFLLPSFRSFSRSSLIAFQMRVLPLFRDIGQLLFTHRTQPSSLPKIKRGRRRKRKRFNRRSSNAHPKNGLVSCLLFLNKIHGVRCCASDKYDYLICRGSMHAIHGRASYENACG